MATLPVVLEAIRDRIEAETSLVRSLSVDSLRHIPDHLQPLSFSAWPGRSTNQRTTRASRSVATIEDEITIDHANRLAKATEAAGFDALLTTVLATRVALTNQAWWGDNDVECIEWIDDRRQRTGAWVIISSTYRVRRTGALG